jgi:protein-tyrosine-phosphatase
MAEALLKMSARRGTQVCSAGIKPGKEVNKQAVKAMREIGCDLSRHNPGTFPIFRILSSTTS